MRIAYLGPPGTWGDQARQLLAPSAEALARDSHAHVVEAVASGQADQGVVAIENSIEGSVTDVADQLVDYAGIVDGVAAPERLLMRAELLLAVRQCLVVREGMALEDITEVYSHTQANGQCRGWLAKHLPRATVINTASTVEPMERLKAQASMRAGAIGSARAAAMYGLTVLFSDIQDRANNTTRFVVLSRNDVARSSDHEQFKTSIAFMVNKDQPGSLVSVLFEFSLRGINISKIESRPEKNEFGLYVFFVDLHCHRTDHLYQQALQCVRLKTSRVWEFGSYPRTDAVAG